MSFKVEFIDVEMLLHGTKSTSRTTPIPFTPYSAQITRTTPLTVLTGDNEYQGLKVSLFSSLPLVNTFRSKASRAIAHTNRMHPRALSISSTCGTAS